MAKTNVLIANDIIADGKVRAAGKIYALEETTATHLITGGRGRVPNDDEVQTLGVTADPALDPGQHVRDMGAPPSSARRGRGVSDADLTP